MIYIVVLVVIFLLLAIAAAAKSGKKSAQKWPFQATNPLSKPEQILYYRLIQALPTCVVLPQVGLSRFLVVKKGTRNPMQWFNRINRMSVDYLVCDRSMRILAAIELDDASHSRTDRQIADNKKNEVLYAAGINLIRWPVKGMPDVAAISAIFSKIN